MVFSKLGYNPLNPVDEIRGITNLEYSEKIRTRVLFPADLVETWTKD